MKIDWKNTPQSTFIQIYTNPIFHLYFFVFICMTIISASKLP